MGKLGLGLGLGRRRARVAEPEGPTVGAEMLNQPGFGAVGIWALNPFSGTASIANGVLTINDPEAENPNAVQTIAALAVGSYRVSITIVSADGNPGAQCEVLLGDLPSPVFSFVGTDSGVHTADVELSSVSNKNFRVVGNQTAGPWVFDDASVKPLT